MGSGRVVDTCLYCENSAKIWCCSLIFSGSDELLHFPPQHYQIRQWLRSFPKAFTFWTNGYTIATLNICLALQKNLNEHSFPTMGTSKVVLIIYYSRSFLWEWFWSKGFARVWRMNSGLGWILWFLVVSLVSEGWGVLCAARKVGGCSVLYPINTIESWGTSVVCMENEASSLLLASGISSSYRTWILTWTKSVLVGKGEQGCFISNIGWVKVSKGEARWEISEQ
jgi:hypothetical protein